MHVFLSTFGFCSDIPCPLMSFLCSLLLCKMSSVSSEARRYSPMRRETVCWYAQGQWKKGVCVNCQHQIDTEAANLLSGHHYYHVPLALLLTNFLHVSAEGVGDGLGVPAGGNPEYRYTCIRRGWPNMRCNWILGKRFSWQRIPIL